MYSHRHKHPPSLRAVRSQAQQTHSACDSAAASKNENSFVKTSLSVKSNFPAAFVGLIMHRDDGRNRGFGFGEFVYDDSDSDTIGKSLILPQVNKQLQNRHVNLG